ncbi:alpha-L-fucosidase [Cyclobacterium sp. 1_MG-2023]|uniref:alpha-L-fucosidase n=1 Tax=Cyclobacterium sp. 1_MG-2023 TaxID=3062681 RepID=UPI0026E18FCB|nr:alpha-L-fucosidase [Cyclobacterium sp. 1_MG-2023]MDO6440311.1 alpha-L-fucosidase [Cyclobacterium sp. 1_MG-2023]
MKLPLTLQKPTQLLLGLCLLLSFSCSPSDDGLLLEPKSTYSIDNDDTKDSIRIKAAHVIPTENQYNALKDEFIAFVHFGPNTFTAKEWGSGMEDPTVFDLKELDTDQWCKAMKAAGMTKVIFTAKHHDGFVLWQSRYTSHGLMSTGFRNGKGDVLKDLAASCEKYGLDLGVYLSPADLYQIENPTGLYGNLSKKTKRTIPRAVKGRPFENKTTFEFEVDDYNEYFLNQLFELLTEYGPIKEVWFDGAHPKRKGGQTYDYSSWKTLIRKLAPEAVIFGRQDIRWCGNESGQTREIEWNVIPYQENPNQMNRFADITGEDVASLEKLSKANYLHYQPAETNTSIREGWFYRNDNEQGVRSADDVFDMYERAVGGNSIFLLNIPPNTQGIFPERDVKVLEEVGKRIRNTYSKDLLMGAQGPKEVLDNDDQSYLLLDQSKSFEISLKASEKINRLIIQEAIRSHGERVAAFSLEALLDDEWKEIAHGYNIGYKNILRFPEVSTNKLRITVDEERYIPAINKVAAYYYETRPPQLNIERSLKGMVNIEPKKVDFGWKTYEQDIAGSLNKDLSIRYTLDGTEPNTESRLYEGPFQLKNGEVKATAFGKNDRGAIAKALFGAIKANWKIVGASSSENDHEASKAIDGNKETYYKAKGSENGGQQLTVDLGTSLTITGFTYLPPSADKEGMIALGNIYYSSDGSNWKLLERFEFGNLINDPTLRRHDFKKPIETRFVKLEAKRIAGGHGFAAIAELGLLVK